MHRRNLEHVDVALIDRAERELDMAAYVLTDWPVMQVSRAPADRGVAIRIYLDGTQLAEREQAKVFNDPRRIPKNPVCLADEPVSGEPVCEANSLLAGNLQGIFPNLNQIRRRVYGPPASLAPPFGFLAKDAEFRVFKARRAHDIVRSLRQNPVRAMAVWRTLAASRRSHPHQASSPSPVQADR